MYPSIALAKYSHSKNSNMAQSSLDDRITTVDDGDDTLTVLIVPRDRLYGRRTRWLPRLLLRALGIMLASYGVFPLLLWLLRPYLRHDDWLDRLVNEMVPGLVANVLLIYVAATMLLAALYGG
jgi:hypothetical protein